MLTRRQSANFNWLNVLCNVIVLKAGLVKSYAPSMEYSMLVVGIPVSLCVKLEENNKEMILLV